MKYTKKIQLAIKFAAKTHNQYQNQKRKGKELPYIIHPLTVAIILTGISATEDVIVAGILHDTIEDSSSEKKVSPQMLIERFGQNVCDLVISVTEIDKEMSWLDRKMEAIEHIKHFSHDSLLLKSADVISNVSEILDDYQRYGDEVFSRFSVGKDLTIEKLLQVMNTIIAQWDENPLIEDLKLLISGLSQI